jgi:hypothetical protein
MKKCIFLFFSIFLLAAVAKPQGCMAVRHIAGFGQYGQMEYNAAGNQWFLNVNNRYFRAFRTFKETKDQNTPKASQVVNKTFTTDFTILRLMNNGWSIAGNVPIAVNSRSTTFEHSGTRHATRSFGLGDIRFTVYKWLMNPATHAKGNIQLGLGIKLPTGDYKYQDYYYVNDSTKVLNPVDQSIQLGDGGTGLIIELNSFLNINRKISLYGNLFYMANPREHNGVTTAKNASLTATSIKAGSDVMSVPDQFTARVGADILFGKLGVEAGIRAEGVPVHDLIGGSSGLRRAGYNISAEPGISYRLKSVLLYAYVPVSLKRSISQSVTDKNISRITGTRTVSPGGFPDYLVFAGVSFKL